MLTVPTTIAEDRIVHLMENRLSWMSAFEICRYHDWQLLTLRSNQEHEETVELMKKYDIELLWLASTDMGHEGKFVWATTGLTVTDYHWQKGEPNNNGIQHCVLLHSPNTKWWDYHCHSKYPFICEETKFAPKKLKGNCTLTKDDNVVSCILNEI